jgi:hypothetical protein
MPMRANIVGPPCVATRIRASIANGIGHATMIPPIRPGVKPLRLGAKAARMAAIA